MENDNILTKSEIERYSRQILLPEIGKKGQLLLKNAKVLIVGAGGLGCPVGMYLAASGVKFLSIVDYDRVDISNLHRQVIFKESDLGFSKAQAFADSLKQQNSKIVCHVYKESLSSSNAISIIENSDVVVDATDNVATRYLLNDACVISGKPLVSGSALRFEGQLTVYNFKNGPCYRCLFPEPPPPETVTNCSDGGVLGPVTGVIGSMQAMEVMKIILGLEPSYLQKLLLYNGQDGSFRQIKLRPKQENCQVCGDNPTITKLIDYAQFCGAPAQDKTPSISILEMKYRISCDQYANIRQNGIPHLLIDVRNKHHFQICQLPDSINIPIDEISDVIPNQTLNNVIRTLKPNENGNRLLYIVCRRGNDSQVAVKALKDQLDADIIIKDIIGGLQSYAKNVDPNFPIY